MRYFLDYLIHFLTSNSRHGTHSPFVYLLTDQVIYSRRKEIKPKGTLSSTDLIADIASFYQVDIVTADADKIDHNAALQAEIHAIDIDDLAQCHTISPIIILTDIHRSKANLQRWKEIQADPRFIVSIDLFHFGLLFYRTEQRKQNFKLRYPFWKY